MVRDSATCMPNAVATTRQRMGRRAIVCRLGAAVAALAATAMAPALGATPRAHADTTVTVPFTTPGEHAFTVPVGVTSVHVVAIGGKGGNGEAPGLNGAGGFGAAVTADLQIPQDVQTLYIEVGGNGGSASGSLTGGAGGANDGGAGGNSNGSFATGGGGGGGGASDVRTCSLSALPTTCVTLDSRLLVAAGGGGGGSGGSFMIGPPCIPGMPGMPCIPGMPGGMNPGGNGGNAGQVGASASEGTGGAAGTSTVGGSGGVGMTGGTASTGLVGAGGAGSGSTGGGGGGGGGGYYGGGGGGGGLAFGSGGGGGGSSYVGAPTTNRTIQGQTGTNGWYQGPAAPTLALTATDSTQNVSIVTDTTGTPSVTLSYTLGTSTPDPSTGITTSYSLDGGTTWQPYTGTVALPDGQYTLAYRSADQVGNTEVTHTLPLTIDTQAPAITATVATTTSTGWYTAPVDVSFTCTDATSGITSCPSPTTLSTEGSNQSATGQATDNAGNTATASASGIDIDLTPPHTSADVPANPVSSAAVTLTASDNLSGVAATHYSVDGGPQQDGTHVTVDGVGTHTLTYWSVDAAGNAEAPQSAQVTIEAPATPTATATDTPVPAATNTPLPPATSTSVPEATSTPVPSATDTPAPSATSTPQSSKQEQGSISSPNTPINTPQPAATSAPTNTPQPAATATPPAMLPVTLNASPTPGTPAPSGNPLASVPRSASRAMAIAQLSDTLLPHKATRWHSPVHIGRIPVRITMTTLPHATVLFDLAVERGSTAAHAATRSHLHGVYHLQVHGVADGHGHVSKTLINHYIPGHALSAQLRIVVQAPHRRLSQAIPVLIQS